MGNLRRIGYRVAAGLVVALAPAPALARADEPSPPDPSVMDIVDLVLAENPGPATTGTPVIPPAPTTQPQPRPPTT